jgi:hypothetical protein
MKLVGKVINELIDSDKSLVGPLLKTQVLASRLKNEQLLLWVTDELSGYRVDADVPAYRISDGDVKGTIVNGNRQYPDCSISLSHLPDKEVTAIKFVKVVNSVKSLENLKDSKRIAISINGERQAYIEQSVRDLGNPYYQILKIYTVPSITLFSDILSSIRSKLLNFMLTLEKEFGNESKIKDLKDKNSAINYIMNTTINGDGNLVNTGDNASIEAVIHIQKADKNGLANVLRSNGIDETDISALLEIVDKDVPPEKNKYSKGVAEWMTRLLNKSIAGSWQVGIGAAGGIIADALSAYFGWK